MSSTRSSIMYIITKFIFNMHHDMVIHYLWIFIERKRDELASFSYSIEDNYFLYTIVYIEEKECYS